MCNYMFKIGQEVAWQDKKFKERAAGVIIAQQRGALQNVYKIKFNDFDCWIPERDLKALEPVKK